MTTLQEQRWATMTPAQHLAEAQRLYEDEVADAPVDARWLAQMHVQMAQVATWEQVQKHLAKSVQYVDTRRRGV